jgi:hypothetical protein
MSPTLEDQERHLLVKVINKIEKKFIIYKIRNKLISSDLK